MRLTFVCTGNICRSPMAEGLFRAVASARGLGSIEIGSAGLFAEPGTEAVPEALAVARANGIDVSGHRARMLKPTSLGEDDLLVVMEVIHRRRILEGGRVKPGQVVLLGSFDPQGPEEIEDPYGGPEIAYELCIARLKVCVEELAVWLEAGGKSRAGAG